MTRLERQRHKGRSQTGHKVKIWCLIFVVIVTFYTSFECFILRLVWKIWAMADQDAHWVWSKGEGKLDGVTEGDGVDGGRRHRGAHKVPPTQQTVPPPQIKKRWKKVSKWSSGSSYQKVINSKWPPRCWQSPTKLSIRPFLLGWKRVNKLAMLWSSTPDWLT